MNINVEHDRINQRFTVDISGRLARLEYKMRGEDTIDLLSTFVPREHRKKGIAREIVTTGLQYARKNNLKVIPTCSYVEAFIEENEEYKDLVIS